MRRNYEQPSKRYKCGYVIRNVKTRARKTSRVFPEVSGSRDSPLVLVEAPSQGQGFPLILARTKCSLVDVLLHSEAVDSKPRTMPSQESSLEAAHNLLGRSPSGSASRPARGSRSPRVTSKALLEGSLARALSTQGR